MGQIASKTVGIGVYFIAILGILLFIGLIFLIWFISTNNWFKKTKVKIDESNSGIDVQLTKRYDLLTKSFNTVKGYAKHESETLANVIKLRNSKGISSMTTEEKSQFNAELDKASKELNVVVEQYPDLKADKAFTKLQDQISDCEDNIQAARRIYNSNISIYNQKVEVFPSSIVAKAKKYTKQAFFEAEEHKRQDVNIEF